MKRIKSDGEYRTAVYPPCYLVLKLLVNVICYKAPKYFITSKPGVLLKVHRKYYYNYQCQESIIMAIAFNISWFTMNDNIVK